jgi:hypothetical protein
VIIPQLFSAGLLYYTVCSYPSHLLEEVEKAYCSWGRNKRYNVVTLYLLELF